MPEITDPATELHKLCMTLKAARSDSVTHHALAGIFGVQSDSSEYFQILGHIAGRFGRLAKLYETLLDEPVRSVGLQTVQHLQSILSTDRQRRPWTETKDRIFEEGRLNVLLMSVPVIRRSAPLTVPTTEERTAAIKQIDAAIETLSRYHGAISTAISTSLSVIKQTLERLDIYGVDGFADEFLRAFAIRTAADREVDVPEPERKARASAWVAITMVAGFLIGSDALITSLENHYARSDKVIRLLVAEQKLLPPPSKDAPAESKNAVLPTSTKPTRKRKPKT